ncbi:MAG: family 10 glycosylhydrolase [Bacteroidia bacterium]|nr:family 10 glycosylhydrolase [Bacteroidia bacterium]
MNFLFVLMYFFSRRPSQLALLLFFPLMACATDPPPTPPKYEFRAVWVATFHNIDWPSDKGLPSPQQKEEYQALVQRQKTNGMNALLVQIRPSGDAFYPSRFAPWSEFVTGKQGVPPSPYYDPLAFMVEETHAANMEFHAWMNPFRAISHKRFSSVDQSNAALRHPEWCFDYGERTYFNPGLPEVRDYLIQIVMEVVKNYDIDGVHFDDYFYPYEEPGNPFVGDLNTFRTYGAGFDDIHDWRRHTLDLFIRDLSDSIRSVKPWVKFGVSPVGIWRNKKDDPRGSATSSSHTAYDMLHADVRFWLVKGWIDYVAPQLYWSTSHPLANFNELLPWWAANSFGRHVYVGHAAFKLEENISRYWVNPSQLPLQLTLRREMQERIQGGVFYSAHSFESNPHGLEDMLRNNFHRFPAFAPPMPWKDPLPPLAVTELEARRNLSNVLLSWNPPTAAADGDTASLYAIYRFRSSEAEDLTRMDRLLGLSSQPFFIDQRPLGASCYYLVTSMDRLHNESVAVRAAVGSTMKQVDIHSSPLPTTAPSLRGGNRLSGDL